eukprot:m.122789 g.122789  ORF g.122789 m.122789 type:complete len:57 (-) comp15551_c2_seq1:1118-1288(-)
MLLRVGRHYFRSRLTCKTSFMYACLQRSELSLFYIMRGVVTDLELYKYLSAVAGFG